MDSVIGLGEAEETESLTPPRGEGDSFVVMQPSEPHLYAGPLASDPSVTPAPVGALWRPGPPPPSFPGSLKRVVLHIHGGAFVRDHPGTPASGFLSRTLVDHAGADAVLSPRYRLSSAHGGRNPFPAALQDALTAYLYLVKELGIPQGVVTLSGDSAGGNIAVALLRYLGEFGRELGLPGAPGSVFLIAPWVAPAACFPRRPVGEPTVQEMANYHSDFLPASLLRWGASAYAPGGNVEASRENPYIHALGHPFAAGAPVLVSVGGAEILSADGMAWAREMNDYGGGGNRVEVYVEVNAPHDTLLVGDSLGWVDSARRVAARIGEFIDST